MRFIVAIDGPSGAGKGTVARAVARQLECRHIDTGAMYRALAWKASTLGVPLNDGHAVARLAREARFELEAGQVRIDGDEVTREIRTPEIDRAAADVARLPDVRAVLVARQRGYGTSGSLVMEGRDIGTVVFPDADVKVYLDATPAERARRRATDPAHASGAGASRGDANVASVASQLEARDHSDRTREASPLTIAPDAVLIDTTGVPIEGVVRQVLEIVRVALDRRGQT